MTKHKDIEELIQKCLDREIGIEENINLQLHLSQCPECMSLYNELIGVENHIHELNQFVPNHDFNNRVLKAIRIKKSSIWAKVSAICCGAWLVTAVTLILSPLSSDVFNRIITASPAVVRFVKNVQFIGSTLTRVFSPLAKSQFNPTVCIIGLALSIGMFYMFGNLLRKKDHMHSIRNSKYQKSNIKYIGFLVLVLIETLLARNNVEYPGLMPEVVVTAQRDNHNEIAMMPEVLVTAPKYNENEAMMPEIVVTAPRPIRPTEIALTTDRPVVSVKQNQNPSATNHFISLESIKQIAVEIKNRKGLSDPEIVKAAVNVKIDRYTKRHGKLIIESADTVKEDIKFSGGNAVIDGVLDGDFSLMGGEVKLNGLIKGDVSLLGGSMNINGKINGDVAVLGGNIFNKGMIDGDLLVAGGSIKLDSGSVVSGDIAIVGGSIEKDTNAIVKGEIKAVNIKILGRTLHKFPDLYLLSEGFPKILTSSFRVVGLIMVWVGFFVLVLLVALIFPRQVVAIAQKTQVNVWLPIAIGFGMQILIVPLIMLMAVSLIGIPVIPLFILALFACLLLGLTSVFYLIGSRIKHTEDTKQSLIGKFALGFIVVMALPILGALIRIVSPIGGLFGVLGFIILYVVATIGLGAAFYTLVTHRKQ